MSSRIRAQRFRISDVIRNISGHVVIPINLENPLHSQIVEILHRSLSHIISNDNIFYARRPNDISDNTIGECLEDRIQRVFNSRSQNLSAIRLREKGYPNLKIVQNQSTIAYLEVKVTSTTRRSESSARDFYISPGTVINASSRISSNRINYTFDIQPGNTSRKIQFDAPHILILCKAENLGSSNRHRGYNCWKLLDYKLFDLSNLELKLKIEFNANYRDIERLCNRL